MAPRTIILIFAALLTAGGTIYFAQSWISSQRAELEAMKKKPVKEEAETQVLVAKKNLPAGLFVKPEDVEWRSWPKDGVAPTYFLKGKVEATALIGSVVRRGITAGEPMSQGKLAKPGDQGFLAAVLQPGMRAVTVPINTSSGVAGFVFPGDRVDLLLTSELSGGGRGKRYATETVLTKVRVLAMDQRVNDVENTPKVSKTITFEVTPKQAEMIAVADRVGRLSLSLRSLAADEQEELRKDVDTMTAVKAGEGDTTKSADMTKTAEAPKQDNSVAADREENLPPERGKSVTFDSEASRLVGPRGNSNQVVIIRGAKVQSTKTSGGAGGGKADDTVEGGSASSDGEDHESASDEDGAGVANGAGAPSGAAAPQPAGTAAPQQSGATGTDGVDTLGTSATDLLKRGRL